MYDHARRRKTKRSGRERGRWVYLPGPDLDRMGFGDDDGPVWYRTFPGERGRAVVVLYRDAT
jgi:hypothetical protein